MKDLISRLEKATGPDRELDAEIWSAIYVNVENSDADILARLQHEPPAKVLDDIWGRIWRDHGLSPPRFTGSIVDALTLLPAGLYWLLSHGKLSDDEPLGAMAIFRPGEADEALAAAEAPTVELAACIAILKARLAMAEKT